MKSCSKGEFAVVRSVVNLMGGSLVARDGGLWRGVMFCGQGWWIVERGDVLRSRGVVVRH